MDKRLEAGLKAGILLMMAALAATGTYMALMMLIGNVLFSTAFAILLAMAVLVTPALDGADGA